MARKPDFVLGMEQTKQLRHEATDVTRRPAEIIWTVPRRGGYGSGPGKSLTYR
jgi:hypothetical protein